MSDSLSPEQFVELRRLIQAMHDERITPEEAARLDAWLLVDEEARRVYVQYMYLCARLRWDHRKQPFEAQKVGVGRKKQSGGTVVLGFLGDALQAGANFLSRTVVLTLLLTVGLPAVLLAILLIQIGSQPHLKPPAAVATISQTHRCIWEEGGAPTYGVDLPPGERIRLREGLVELVFTGGARAILQGPATFEATNGSRGFLDAGSLVANVPKGAGGFTVETPAITVVDLGTEFGVRIEDEGREADIQVFQGEVELAPAVPAAADRPRHRLVAGRAVRVAMIDQQKAASITDIPPQDGRFVRQLPPVAPAESAIVADFSGGNGDTLPDQFPGVAGAGWAGGWVCPPGEGTRVTASVERANPVRDGGDYLRVLVERTSEAAVGEHGIERSLESDKPIDLARPYEISFTVRIDALGGFAQTSRNRFALCNMGQLHGGQAEARSGWRIQFGAKDGSGVKARHWYFVPGDGKGGWQAIDSGIAVREGESYSFRIVFDPMARQWTPSIAVDGGPWTTFATMPARSPGTAEELGYWSRLYFYWAIQKGYPGGAGTMIGFSVDSVRITAVEKK